MSVELITCTGGDWEILKVRGRSFSSGHSIPNHDWVELLKYFGIEVKETEVSDEEMEELC